MPTPEEADLSSDETRHFVDAGFVKVDRAFSAEQATRCRSELWTELGLSPERPEAWTRPVVRLGFMGSRPFVDAANTPRLHRAYDRLAGRGHWQRPEGVGTFPIRFGSAGGSDAPANRVTLCAFHHLRGVHAGRLRCTGRAPDGLQWQLGIRPGAPPLLSYRSGDVRARLWPRSRPPSFERGYQLEGP